MENKNSNRMLNIGYAIEVLCGRLNGSSSEVEKKNNSYKNSTYTKKIGNRSRISSQCQKYNQKLFMEQVCGYEQNVKTKDGKQVKLIPNPFKYATDDIFGFMMAEKLSIEEDVYNELSDEEKEIYKKNKKKYEANITKKRKSRWQMNSLINVSNRKVEWEWNVCGTTGDSMPYQVEVYSGVHANIANLNIGKIGEYDISDIASEHRDYTTLEAKSIGVEKLDKEEKFKRIEALLKSLEYLSIEGNKTNHLTDTKPKFVILGEYSWGNNVFQGIVKENGLDIEMLKESIEQNEEFRQSDIWIGINKFYDDTFNEIEVNNEKKQIKKCLEEEFEEYDFIKISNVHEAFESYKKFLKETL
ncbi:DNA repair protein [Clostridioides difficile]